MRSEDIPGPGAQDGAAPAGLTIHALSAGGGILALCPLPGGGGDYRNDLIQIYQWKPGLVISMTTEVEHAAAGVPRLGIDLQSMACRWLHLPVPDFQAPPPGVAAKWPAASASARQALAGGGRVLVHCRGGCGRSGMAVLRLMIEGGEDPAQALARLRAVRPCAVETDEQLHWACAGQAAG
ncbi:protein-tyrosine phosphatase family protein [Leisingera methylohalidivorans]|uniref:Protein phosphatase n=1 Tax=Leisingera methylohalidivorans DSM 14336 TaxID=999552 RepID=V9VPY2_9RHOB|nr:protein-tyrosine phosphatase family protein [Leisingera methylohalidivorans]AHC99748.1 protein phosphatase [Leisingera methylohalidivorans DSM 14336]